jgi:hypothetical protein
MVQTRPFSPVDGCWVKDDFVGNDAVADATVGEMRWEMTTIGNASTTTLPTGKLNGVLRDATAATADGDGEIYRTFTDGLTISGLNGGGGFAARARLVTAIAANNFRIGVDDSVTAATPAVGVWVDCDGGVLALRAGSNTNGSLAASVAGVSTLTGGTTMVVDTWHDFLVTWTGENGVHGPRWVELWVDGELGASCLCNIGSTETAELKIAHWQDSGGALSLIMEVDYYEFWQWRSN